MVNIVPLASVEKLFALSEFLEWILHYDVASSRPEEQVIEWLQENCTVDRLSHPNSHPLG
jgi:hypothetical protein